MKTAKDIAIIGVYTALMIGAQFALSAISGVELVTVLFLSFCFCFGVTRGIVVANAFSLLRCFVFGFFPTVLILYLVYYNIFAVVFGLLGKWCKRQVGAREKVITVLTAIVMTVFFTALDDIITPLYYGYSLDAAKAYALASVAAMIPQIFCVAISVTILFPVLVKAFRYNMIKKNFK